jgi:GAF domain-containing protein
MPSTEAARIAALKHANVLDTGPDPLFDQLTQLGARRLRMEPESTPREVAFCDHAIRGNSVMIIPDATKDPRFSRNPLVTDGIKIRFYAGAPITYEGQNIGTVCVIDYKPNPTFSDQQVRVLEQLAEMAAKLLQKETPDAEPDSLLL